jgi:ribonuclease HI
MAVCLEEELSKWADRIERKLRQLGINPEYELISRKENREADKLASPALKEIEITSTSETKLEQ